MKHILLVDDEPEVLEGLIDILKPLPDVSFHTATLANHALNIMERQPITLVIADIRMPGMNGIDMWEQIRRRLPRCRVIFLSGVRDFDNIYRVIQSPNARFLTKLEPEEKIYATVEEALAELDEQDQMQVLLQQRQLYACLEGSEAEQLQARRLLREQPGPLVLESGMACAFFAVTNAWALSRAEKQDAQNRLSASISEYSQGAPFHFLWLNDALALWLLQAPDGGERESRFPAQVQELCSRSERDSVHALRGVFDTGLHSADELATRYHELSSDGWLAEISQRKALSFSNMYSDTDFHAAIDAARKLRFSVQALQGYLKLGQKTSFRTMATMLFDESALRLSDSASQARYVYFGILALMYRALEQSGHDELREAIRREHSSADISRASRAQLMDRLLDFADKTFEALFPYDPYSQPEVVSGIQNYIHDHLGDDLSLNALSTRFGMNPSYLSRCFRENANCKLHDYITQFRLGTAERLLRTSGLRVHEIAVQVGYDSSHTFIRAFKRRYGRTPVEYRSKFETND